MLLNLPQNFLKQVFESVSPADIHCLMLTYRSLFKFIVDNRQRLPLPIGELWIDSPDDECDGWRFVLTLPERKIGFLDRKNKLDLVVKRELMFDEWRRYLEFCFLTFVLSELSLFRRVD
jgi:hypothetical protein